MLHTMLTKITLQLAQITLIRADGARRCILRLFQVINKQRQLQFHISRFLFFLVRYLFPHTARAQAIARTQTNLQ